MQSPANKGSEPSRAAEQALDVLHASRRRRLIRAGASGAAVLLAVKARTALGQTACLSPSAVVSGNMSTQPTTTVCTLGATPTFWKLQTTLESNWLLLERPSFAQNLSDESSPCNNGHAIEDLDSLILTPGKLVSDMLPGAPGISAWAVLAFPDVFAGSDYDLMRALIAAWFNARLIGEGYPLRVWHIEEMWMERNNYCPASITCTPEMGMTESEILAYVRGTFDLAPGSINNPAEIYVCIKNAGTPLNNGTTGNGKTSNGKTTGQ